MSKKFEALKPSAKLLYFEIVGHCNLKGFCEETNGYFGYLFHLHPGSISRLISSIKKAGLIKVEINKELGNLRKITLI